MMTKNKRDCFGYKNGECNILTVNKCEGPSCGFYKTKEQLQKERQQVIRHIQSLDLFTQEHIQETYFSGKLNELEAEQN